MNWMTINMRGVFKGFMAVARVKLVSKWVGKSRRVVVVEAAAAVVMLAAAICMAKNRQSVANDRLSVVVL